MQAMVKDQIRKLAGRAGYSIEKSFSLAGSDIDVFDLAVRVQMSDRHTLRFLQVGANDGISFDPIRDYVLRFGWSGVLLEPQPVAFASLIENYKVQPGLEFVNAALGPSDGTTDFFTSASGDDVCAGLDARSVERYRGPEAVTKITVKTVSAATLMQKFQLHHADLLQVDVEGFDCQIVGMLLDAGMLPAMIRFEFRHVGQDELLQLTARLDALGYKMTKVERDVLALRVA